MAERYQWKRNADGGQKFGNRQVIYKINQKWFALIKPLLRDQSWTMREWRRLHPLATHVSIIYHNAAKKRFRLQRVGSLDELRPAPSNPDWVKRVRRFDSPAALRFGRTPD